MLMSLLDCQNVPYWMPYMSLYKLGYGSPLCLTQFGLRKTGYGVAAANREATLASRKWRSDFAARVAQIDARSTEKKEEMLSKAKEDLAAFYTNYEHQKEATAAHNRCVHATLGAELAHVLT